MESKYSPLILALVFLILFFVFIIKNENANNPSQKTNKVSVQNFLHGRMTICKEDLDMNAVRLR